MEKWKIPSELDPAMSGMDLSQMSELATAMMDTWGPSSDHLSATQTMLQSSDSGNKTLFVKQEVSSDYPGVIPMQGFNPTEQVPMDDFDPLESFSFWDGENFYCHDSVCNPSGSEMQVEGIMPPLLEYVDEMTRDDMVMGKDDSSGFLHNNPTLAELNSCGETVFDYAGNFNFLGEDNSFNLMATDTFSKSFPESHFVASPAGSSSIANSSFSSGLNYMPSGLVDIKQEPAMSSSCPIPSRIMASNSSSQPFLSVLEDKYPLCPQNSPASESFFPTRAQPQFKLDNKSPSHSPGVSSPMRAVPQRSRLQDPSSGGVLSSSAPPDMTLAARVRGERPSSHSPRSVTERSLSGFSSLSLSNDEESGSFFDDDDDDDDYSSDDEIYPYESDDPLSTSWPSGGKDEKPCRKHRYFWQYNLQSRGAKTHNILPRTESRDPHILNDAFDPVFAEDCTLPVKHSGKARRGDGNDLTPDPRKLFSIGIELKKLNRMIYNVHPGDSGPGKPLSRKEKNKLASRVCRLKKKAQHEANKIKLYGLQLEHKKLLSILVDVRELLKYKIGNLNDTKVSNCSKKLETFVATNEPHRVAGNTAPFVNEVLDKVAKGVSDGGLSRF